MKQEDIQKALEALSKGGINVNGDLVLEKHVEHEIGNVEAGGIGIQINNGEIIKENEEVIADAIDENIDENDDEQGEEEELNYESPKINLQQLLKQPWFAETRSNEKYDSEWTDAFMEALMGSEYGEEIARDWAWNIDKERNRHIEINGYVLGLLKDAGVLKETKRKIAKKIVEEQNEGLTEDVFKKKIGNLSRNMYSDTAGKQPYADWVKNYVEKH